MRQLRQAFGDLLDGIPGLAGKTNRDRFCVVPTKVDGNFHKFFFISVLLFAGLLNRLDLTHKMCQVIPSRFLNPGED